MSSPTYTTDTSAEAEALQLELLRKMTPQERIEMMCRLSNNVRQMAIKAIRRRHPDYSEAEVRMVFIELTYGSELANEVKQWQDSQS